MHTPIKTLLTLTLTAAASAQTVDWHPSDFQWSQTETGAWTPPQLPVPRLPEFEPKTTAELKVVVPRLRVEGTTLEVTAPADSPALLVVGPRLVQGNGQRITRSLPGGASAELAPRELVPFRLDAEGRASLELPALLGAPNQRLQVIVFNANRTEVAVQFPSYGLDDLRTGTQAAASGPGYTISAGSTPGGNGYGSLNERCTSFCPSCEDLPDTESVDSNCDGIDGDIARALFVDLVDGSSSGAGTMADPLSDLQFAIDLAAATPGKDHVYVSADIAFGPIYLSDGISVWGGFDPDAGWSRSSGIQTAILNLFISGTSEGYVGVYGANIHSPTVFADFEVEVWGGGFLLQTGGTHAIGMHMYQVSALTLERVTVTAAYASLGNGGASVGNGTSNYTGGNGGSGGTSSSLPGSGSTGGGSSCGLGGFGGLGGAPYFNGFTGVTGVVGLPGAWASATSFGTPSISGTRLVMGGTGNNGSSGCKGGAGGGGGGGGYAWPVGNGGNGGKGGSGGKAGLGGKGGKPAGCSVALMLVSSDVTVLDSALVAHDAGLGGTPGSSSAGTGGSGGSSGQVLSGLPDGGQGGPGASGGIGGFSSPGASGHCYAVLASSGSHAELLSTTLQATDPGSAFPWFPSGIAGEAVLYKQL